MVDLQPPEQTHTGHADYSQEHSLPANIERSNENTMLAEVQFAVSHCKQEM